MAEGLEQEKKPNSNLKLLHLVNNYVYKFGGSNIMRTFALMFRTLSKMLQ